METTPEQAATPAENAARAIELGGGPTAVARRLTTDSETKIGAWAVSKWRLTHTPPEWVLPLARACEWQVTPHELRPDLYPYATDGLPRREAA